LIFTFFFGAQAIDAVWCPGSIKCSAAALVEKLSAVNVKRTWTDLGLAKNRDWTDDEQGRGEEFRYQATQCKNVWLTMGDIFAN